MDAKYPADYSELCPECNESIYLGREFNVSDFEIEGLKVVWSNHHAANRVETK